MMTDLFIYLIITIAALLIGLFLGRNSARLKFEKDKATLQERNTILNQTIQDVVGELKASQVEKEALISTKTRLETELKNSELKISENKEELGKLNEKFTKEFENLANKIFEVNSKKIKEQNKESLEGIINPLQKQIIEFKQKVEDVNKDSIRQSSALKQQLEELNKNNIKISQEAINLTKALKGDNKSQGNWGELVLETVLEKSGLEKGREYEIQQSFVNSDGKRLLPDVVINLPDNKKMIIDSKVSLVAYERYVNSEDKEEKKKLLTSHITSIKRHINDLSLKKYEDIYKIESPDFILMFIPIESALYLAQNEDKNFFYTAFHKNILLVSPTTLLSTLRTIDTLWSNEKQQQNAFEIAKHATSLYEKFKNLLDDLETVGNRIESTSNAYKGAMKKLTGNQNLIKDIDKLKSLGISPKKDIDKKWIDRAIEE
tara:strand:- start:3620 stop:4918 length:1299 start_codon:yes stop_codon:yes gene_type:complete